MKVNKSAHFEFDEKSSTISFVWGIGKSKQREVLVSTKEFYSIAKKVFQEFLEETDLRTKVSKLATAINIGFEGDYLHQLCFLLEVMWRYDFSHKGA